MSAGESFFWHFQHRPFPTVPPPPAPPWPNMHADIMAWEASAGDVTPRRETPPSPCQIPRRQGDTEETNGTNHLSTSVASAHSHEAMKLSHLSMEERNKDLETSADGVYVPNPHLYGMRDTHDDLSHHFSDGDEYEHETQDGLSLAGSYAPSWDKEVDEEPKEEVSVSSRGKRFSASPADAAARLAALGSAHVDEARPAPLISPELKELYSNLQRCLEMRDEYMLVSHQFSWEGNPKNWDAEYVEQLNAQRGAGKATLDYKNEEVILDGCALAYSPDDDFWSDGSGDRPALKPWRVYPAPPRPHWEHFTPAPASSFVVRPTAVNPLPPAVAPASPANAKAAGELLTATGGVPGKFDMKYMRFPDAHTRKGRPITFRRIDGVFQVFEETTTNSRSADSQDSKPLFKTIAMRQYYRDLDFLSNVVADGPTRSFAWRRLKYLESKWNLYTLLNEYRELDGMKKVPHRDFYNVRKVDTHIHHSASMNQKHLLRFIKAKIKHEPDDVVIYRDGKYLTLQEVFQSLGLTAYDLSIDTLDMHAHQDAFHRFDKFNLKYNPLGESRLREIFLKTDNLIHGRYLAEITKELMSDLEASKYQMTEYRLSIYGRNKEEWAKLAAWVVDNDLFSPNVRWLIQIPRLYDVYKANGTVDNFEQVIDNIFAPLFEATHNPSAHRNVHVFLQRVVGFDLVDDESKPERREFRKFPPPAQWNGAASPPYSYWSYFMFANLTSLNQWRAMRGYNTFVLRPHAGEAGDPEHLASTFLTSQSISHGIQLRKVPTLQYLYYLKQIGLAMSPLSNNALFLSYDRNPFPTFLKLGMNVSLSTDDPLQFHLSKEPLLEEYSVATQIYKLRASDMCELARNSVLQSGWEMELKRHWLGKHFYLPGPRGNVVSKSNVPSIRLRFREQTLREELDLIWSAGHDVTQARQ